MQCNTALTHSPFSSPSSSADERQNLNFQAVFPTVRHWKKTEMSVLTRGSFLFLSFLLLSPLSGAERDDDGLCSASDGDGGDGGCHEVDSPPEDEGDEERRRRVEKEVRCR